MSTELINRITIKKDGVYISTHSSNDTSPFYSTKNDFLTDTYNKQGQEGLDKAIIDLCFYNCELKGNHKSIVSYKEAIEKAIYDKDFIEIRNEYNELSDKVFDIANGFDEYKKLPKEQRDQLYEEIKPKVEGARNKRNDFVANIVKEIRESLKLEQIENKKIPESITLNFENILSEMKNKDIKFILGIGNTMCIEDSQKNLYQIETYYHGSYLEKMIKNGYTVTFNPIETKQTEHLNDLYKNEKKIFDYNDMQDFLVEYWHTHNTDITLREFLNMSSEEYQKLITDDINKDEDEIEI